VKISVLKLLKRIYMLLFGSLIYEKKLTSRIRKSFNYIKF